MRQREQFQYGERVFLVQNLQKGVSAAYKRLKKGEFAEYEIQYTHFPKFRIGRGEPTRYAVRYVNEGRVTNTYYTFYQGELSRVPETPAPFDLAVYL